MLKPAKNVCERGGKNVIFSKGEFTFFSHLIFLLTLLSPNPPSHFVLVESSKVFFYSGLHRSWHVRIRGQSDRAGFTPMGM